MGEAVNSTSPSCLTCLDLQYWDESDLPVEARRRVKQRDDSTRTFRLRQNYTDLENSSGSCQICAIIADGLILALGRDCIHRPHSTIEIPVGCNMSTRVELFKDSSSLTASDVIEFYTVQETTNTTQPTAPFPKLSHISPTMDSKLAAQKVQPWLEECLRSHRRCRTEEKPVLPKRLIRLASYDSGPCLYEPPSGQRGDYITLSYCWGSTEHFLTTQRNTSSHTAGIPWDRIPQTLKNAMQLTLELGVEFIWIDALCIVQDDANDWRQHAVKMGEIYQNALLTISATASQNIHSGIFVGQRYPAHNLSGRLSSMGGVDIYVRRACRQTHVGLFEHVKLLGEGHRERGSLSILSRGWIFQERILSRRLLHCGPEELAWECMSGQVQCECSSMEPYNLDTATLGFKENYRAIPETKKIIQDRLLQIGLSESWELTNHPLREWQELLVDYSSCLFTYPTDRLVALESIAREFNKFSLGSYFYGMWEENLPFQLDWAVSHTFSQRTRLDLPTWSWASVYNKCHYSYHPFSPGFECLNLCEIVKVPTDFSLGGDIASRMLVISSRVVDATIQLEDEGVPLFALDVNGNINGHVHRIFEDIQQWPEGSREWRNIPAEERLSNGQPIVCMELSTYYLPSYPTYLKILLVLRPLSDQEEICKRVGVMFLEEQWESGSTGAPSIIRQIDQLATRRTLQII